MERTIERILPLWGIEKEHLSQIYSSAWEINHSYVIKMYDNREQLERNITISTILSDYHIPVAKIVLTRKGEKYVGENGFYFLVSQKLQGCNITDPKDKVMARKMGCAMAQLHKAFRECEKALAFWDNSLLQEMQGWVRDTLINNEWQIVDETEYLKAVGALGDVYDQLPRQLIHRDVHFVDGDNTSRTNCGAFKKLFPFLLLIWQLMETSGITVFSLPSFSFHLYCTLSG